MRQDPSNFDFHVIDSFDWRSYWRELQGYRREIFSDPALWDARAESFASRTISGYSKTFVEYLALEEGQSVLDMGCGTGEIAMQLAKAGHDIIAADFSKSMLSFLKKAMQSDGISELRNGQTGAIKVVEMAWEDDWQKCGIEPDCVDVAYASRSTIVADLGMAIDKLCAVARKRCAITLATGNSPSEDKELLKALGRDSVCDYDMAFTFNILYQMGFRPEVRLIDSDKSATYRSLEHAIEHGIRHVPNPSKDDVEKISEFIEAHLVANDAELDEDDPRPFKLDYPRYSKWAFISWEL